MVNYITCECTRQSSWHPNCSTLESDRPQHDHPAACVTTQQYSSVTFISLRLHYRKKNLCILKMLLHFIFCLCRIACLEQRNLKLHSGCVCNHSKCFPPVAYVTIFRRFCKIAKGEYQFSHFRPFVSPSAWNNLAPTGGIFMKFDIWGYLENLSWKFKFHYTRTSIKGTLPEDQYAVLIISHSLLLRMRNISDKSSRENQSTHFIFRNFFSKIVPCMR
jgi:hypothetical protein